MVKPRMSQGETLKSSADLYEHHRARDRGERWTRATQEGLLDSRPPASTEVAMRLIGLGAIFTAGLTLTPLGMAAAQLPEKVPRVGYLNPGFRL